MMSRFILLDHSIKRIGGHHFEYALQLLNAAAATGYTPVMATNRRFFEQDRIPSSWQLYPLYTHTVYEVSVWLQQLRQVRSTSDNTSTTTPLPCEFYQSPRITSNWRAALWNAITKPWQLWQAQYAESQYQLYLDRFATETQQLCKQLQITSGDQVLLSTINETELRALADCLKNNPTATQADWHLQFHYPIMMSQHPAAERSRHAVFTAFSELARVLGPRLHCYATTERLARQFQELSGLPFSTLPWPTDKALSAVRPAIDPEQPLKLGIPGRVRTEKGSGNLLRIWQGLESEFTQSKRLQFWLQTNQLRKLPKPLQAIASLSTTPTQAVSSSQPVVTVKWPLSSPDYVDFVRRSDIGCLLYQPREYYARLSSILVEYLAAGIPVLVPAGCWLGDQLTEVNWQHRAKLIAELPSLAQLPAARWEWHDFDADSWQQRGTRRPRLAQVDEQSTLTLCCHERPRRSAVLDVPARSTHVALTWDWQLPTTADQYLMIECTARNEQGMTIQRWKELCAPRLNSTGTSTSTQSIMLPLPVATKVLEWTFAEQDTTLPIQVRHLTARFYDGFAHPQGVPLGAVGLIAADESMAVPLLREMLLHYSHYRQSAETHAQTWNQQHHASAIIAQLIAEQGQVHPQRRAA